MNEHVPYPSAVAVIEPVGAHGGMDYYDYALMRGLQKAGVVTRLYTSEAGHLAPDGIFVAETFKGVYGNAPKPCRAAKWLMALRESVRDAVKHGVELVHFHYFDTGLIERAGIWCAKRRGLKVVGTVHDVESFHVKRGRAVSGSLLRSLDGIIVHNETSRSAVSHIAGEPALKIRVIPHGHYLGYVGAPVARDEARARLGLPQNRPTFLFFGQIKKVKGLDIAIRALSVVREKRNDILLLVAGRLWKDERTEYTRLIRAHGLEENVVWHDGYIPDDEVGDHYCASDSVILPYKRIYQSGVLLMAMSYGMPVIASDLEGMKEIIRDGTNGLLFRSEDAEDLAAKMLEIVKEPSRAASLGYAAREYVSQYHDWDSIGIRTKALYDEVLAGRSVRHP